MIVFPVTSMVLAPAGAVHDPTAPTHTILLSVTTTSPDSITVSPRIGTTRAPCSITEPRQRDDVGIVALLREHAVGVGPGDNFIGGLRLRPGPGIGVAVDLEMSTPVGAVPTDRDEPFGAGIVIDPVGVAREVRPAPP